MGRPQYILPDSVQSLFSEKEAQYKIIDYTINGMDNIESMKLFFELVRLESFILLDDGIQITWAHPDFNYHIVIDSGGLVVFFSHGFDVSVETAESYVEQINSTKPLSDEIRSILNKETSQMDFNDLNAMLNFLIL